MSSRRSFLQKSVAAMAGTGIIHAWPSDFQANSKTSLLSHSFLQTGIAGFTFLNFTVDQSIAMMQRLKVDALSLKDFHLPLNSPADKIQELQNKFRIGGINIYAVGVIYMKTNNEVDLAFEYAHKLGVNLIICSPNYELLPYVEENVKKHNIRIAIHNHGPEDKLYPSPKEVYDRISKLDNRLGLCLDIGHAVRAGTDISKAVTDYAPRLFDMHIKDVDAFAKDAQAVELGRGVIDFPSLVLALRKIGYTGRCSIEFEKDMKDPLPGIAESIGFFRGVMDAVR